VGLALAEVFSTSLSDVAERDHFRVGARYRSVWDTFDGRIFKGAKIAYPRVKLSRLIAPYAPKKLPKGDLEDEYVLIDLEDIEDRRGQIAREMTVTSIGSDKIVFGDCDILFSKLRPYLGKVVINDKRKSYIGTTELLPFQTINGTNVEFVKYLMLSRDFLDMATRLMYGKEHPRVDAQDLLNLVVPNPPPPVQDEIVRTLHEEVESKVDFIKTKIVPLQRVIETVFVRHGIKKTNPKASSFTSFNSKFSSCADQKYLRCGSRYRYFWDVREGKMIDVSDFAFDRLGSIADIYQAKKFPKGELDSEYIVVDLPDIMPREGRVIAQETPVGEIGSDKIVFGDADLLYSHLDPFLGHVILNDRSKPYIGTTELIPLKAKEGADPRFVRYLLLSQDFLDVSLYLMYGKRHPRIHYFDMLNMKIPKPDGSIQRLVSDEIWRVEASNIEKDKEIDSLYGLVEGILISKLSGPNA
jgi:Type I restriction modification DNA specificity domain